MNLDSANKLWEALNDVMTSDERLKGYRPVLKHIDGDEVLNSYKVEIREAYDPWKENGPTRRQVMDRWASFCYNHPPYDEVILWMVGGDKQHYLYQHFCSKFLHLCEDVCHNDTMSAWMKFYRTLDDQWADRLLEYVYCEWKKQ